MPLSKKRDRERKRLERVKIRLDKQLCPPQEIKPVQPSIPLYNPSTHRAGDTVRILKGKRQVTITIPELDGEGQPMFT